MSIVRAAKMGELLPDEFDVVVVGTGFVESVVAAAASRIGKTVLHIDPNDFYGGAWASFNLDALQTFISTVGERSLSHCTAIQNASQKWHIDTELEENISLVKDIKEKSRHFNIDLSPKLLFARGKLVDLLVSSNVCRYAEFRAVDNVCTVIDNQIKRVPCSRKDVFNTKEFTLVEKRLLMKLLARCMESNEYSDELKDFKGDTFLEYLKSSKLTDNVIHCILHSICMGDENTSIEEGMNNTKRFLSSLGRYGNTPFLFPMYGCGEIPQCFCRLCAVFGGIYCLKRCVHDIVNVRSQVEEIICDGQKIKLKHLLIGHGNEIGVDHVHGKEIEKDEGFKCGSISRAIYIVSKPLGSEDLNSDGGGVNFLKLSNEEGNQAFIIQLSHYSGTCPKGLYLIHISCASRSNSPESDIKPYLETLIKTNFPPMILYSCYFTIKGCTRCSSSGSVSFDSSSNVYTCCGPSFELDFDKSIRKAEEIFESIFPTENFLPRAPDPEEIIIGNEDTLEAGITLQSVKEQIIEMEASLASQNSSIDTSPNQADDIIM